MQEQVCFTLVVYIRPWKSEQKKFSIGQFKDFNRNVNQKTN